VAAQEGSTRTNFWGSESLPQQTSKSITLLNGFEMKSSRKMVLSSHRYWSVRGRAIQVCKVPSFQRIPPYWVEMVWSWILQSNSMKEFLWH